MDTIRHYANFPATGVSLRQMVQFGETPSVGKYIHSACVHRVPTSDIKQAHCSGLHNSCPKSYPFVSRIEFKSLEIFRMDLMRCHP